MDRSLLDQLIAEPTADRLSVYADVLQTRGDPRGELIALDVHARATNTLRDPRAVELESTLTAELIDQLEGPRGGVTLRWEDGFVREVIAGSAAIPTIKQVGWLAAEPFAMLHTFGVFDTSSRFDDVQPVELLLQLPTLQRLAIGSRHIGLMPPEELTRMLAGLPKLTMLELRALGRLDDDRLLALGQFERLEALALWTPGTDELLERLIDAPWPRLRSLVLDIRGPTGRPLPAYMAPLLAGDKHPHLVELALMSCGFEAALITELPDSALGERLRALGLYWRQVEDDTLEEVSDDFTNIALIWPRPVGMQATGDDEYQLSRRLRVGLDRDREALPHAIRACELEPGDYFHWTEAGAVHDALDQLPEKLAAMDRAIAIDRSRWGGWAGRGSALRDLGRLDEARAAYEAGLELDPTRVSLHHGLGLVLERIGTVDETIAAFEAAVTHSTTDDNRAWYLGSVAQYQLERDRRADAARTLGRAAALAPLNIRIMRVAGYERLAAGLPDRALTFATELAGRAEGENEFFTFALRAAALRELGNLEEASALYQRIVDESNCPSWIAFAWLGLALAGRDHLAPVTEIDPSKLADAIATHVNASREDPTVHDTIDRCNDRINVAVAAIAIATLFGRHDDARARTAALTAFLAGPAPVKMVSFWIELAEMIRATARRVPAAADLLTASYAIATGRRR